MPSRKYIVNHLQFTENQTPVSVYLLGLLWADGYVSRDKETIVLSSTKPDSDYFEKILRMVGSWGFYYTKSKKHPTWKTGFTAAIRNNQLAEFLYNNDYVIKSNAGADKILKNILPNLHKFFFIGLIDGDGCFYVSRRKKLAIRFSITSSFNQDWKFVEKMLIDIGVKYKIERTNSKSGSYSKIHVWKLSELEKLGNYLYSSIQEDRIGLPRKYKKYKLILASVRRRKTSKFAQVCRVKNRWKAYSSQKAGRKFKWIPGSFDTEELAAKAAGTFIF
jgi:intein/homing endonuclease